MAGFFSRLSRIIRGKAHAGVDAIEDATFETTIKQTVRDMETELNRVVRSAADAMSNHNRLEAEYQRFKTQAEDWKSKAMKALKAGNEDLAKKALAKKGECDGQVASLETSVVQSRQVREKLKSQVEQLRQKIAEARRNSSTLIARKNAAKAQKKVAQVLAGIGGGDNAFASLQRFEESVSRDEATAKAYEDMSVSGDSELEKEFAALDTSSADTDLEALKAEMAAAKK